MGDTGAARPANNRDQERENPTNERRSAVFSSDDPLDLEDANLDLLLMEALAAHVHIPEKSRLRAINAVEAVLFYEDEVVDEPTPSVRTRPTLRPVSAPPDSV